MEALQAAFGQQGSGSLYWCGFSDGDVPEHVAALIQHARSHGRQAYYVPSLGFDDVLVRLSLHCLEGEGRDAAKEGIAALASSQSLDRSPFNVTTYEQNELIKSNAFNVECPSEVFAFDLKEWPKEKVWASLRETVAGKMIVAVPLRGKVIALGTIDDIKDAFGENIKGPIERTPVGPNELRFEDSAMVSLMREALIRLFAETAQVNSDHHRELWLSTAEKRVRQNDAYYNAYGSVQVYLRQIGSSQYLVLKPSIKVLDDSGVDVPAEIANPIKLGILGWQHNKPFNQVVNKWRKLLLGTDKKAIFEFPLKCGSSFKFTIRRAPAFGQVGVPHGQHSVNIPQKQRHPLITLIKIAISMSSSQPVHLFLIIPLNRH